MYPSMNDLTEDDLVAAYELQQAARAQRLCEIAREWTAADPNSVRKQIKQLVDSIEETQAA